MFILEVRVDAGVGIGGGMPIGGAKGADPGLGAAIAEGVNAGRAEMDDTRDPIRPDDEVDNTIQAEVQALHNQAETKEKEAINFDAQATEEGTQITQKNGELATVKGLVDADTATVEKLTASIPSLKSRSTGLGTQIKEAEAKAAKGDPAYARIAQELTTEKEKVDTQLSKEEQELKAAEARLQTNTQKQTQLTAEVEGHKIKQKGFQEQAKAPRREAANLRRQALQKSSKIIRHKRAAKDADGRQANKQMRNDAIAKNNLALQLRAHAGQGFQPQQDGGQMGGGGAGGAGGGGATGDGNQGGMSGGIFGGIAGIPKKIKDGIKDTIKDLVDKGEKDDDKKESTGIKSSEIALGKPTKGKLTIQQQLKDALKTRGIS